MQLSGAGPARGKRSILSRNLPVENRPLSPRFSLNSSDQRDKKCAAHISCQMYYQHVQLDGGIVSGAALRGRETDSDRAPVTSPCQTARAARSAPSASHHPLVHFWRGPSETEADWPHFLGATLFSAARPRVLRVLGQSKSPATFVRNASPDELLYRLRLLRRRVKNFLAAPVDARQSTCLRQRHTDATDLSRLDGRRYLSRRRLTERLSRTTRQPACAPGGAGGF